MLRLLPFMPPCCIFLPSPLPLRIGAKAARRASGEEVLGKQPSAGWLHQLDACGFCLGRIESSAGKSAGEGQDVRGMVSG